MHRMRPWVGVLLLGIILGAPLACREEVPPLFRRNRAPETTITIIAETNTNAFYRYHVYWRGEDPDGEVVRYLFAITDTLSFNEEDNWDPSLAVDRDRGIFTTRTDSVFLFNSESGRQTFNIVAIDDFGEMDPSPARAFFRVVDNGLPSIVFLDVTNNSGDPDVAPCVAAAPCTIPTFTDFQMRFTGLTANGSIQGYTWSINGGLWMPYNTQEDTFFLDIASVEGGTVVRDEQGLPVWALSADHDTVTVFQRNTRANPITPGNFVLRARVRDQARRESDRNRDRRLITVNYDPDTRLYTIPACDCPNAPPNCSRQDSVPMGWVTGIGEIHNFPLEEWRPFCPGDTLPNLSDVAFYAKGWDDGRDLPIDPNAGTLPEVQYKFRFEYFGPDFSSTNMEFSRPALRAQDLPLPGGGTFRGAAVTYDGLAAKWQTCPYEYRFEAGAVDENDQVDGTPASIRFVVGGTPVLDSLKIADRVWPTDRSIVMVFVPRCIASRVTFCQDYEPILPPFGADTVVVYGRTVADSPLPPWATTFGLGWNDFIFPFNAWGHDHPRDRNPPGGPFYYVDATVGRVRSWHYSYDCVDPGCSDVSLPGEDLWRANVRPTVDGVDIFADTLFIRIALDTLCTTPGCAQAGLRATLSWERFGGYAFSIEGRDTEFIGQICRQPSDLGATSADFFRDISELGRTTQLEQRRVVWRQLGDVRPVAKSTPRAAGTHGGPFTTRKRLMQ